MIYRIADNILSPLGVTTEQNYRAVVSGGSALKHYDGKWGLPESFTAALFEEQHTINGLTRFESLVVRSVEQAMVSASFDIGRRDVLFILSTTKGDVELLGQSDGMPGSLSPGDSAQRIATYLGVKTTPVVVCNACISGVSAIVLASRLLVGAQYRHAIVCGADVLGRFIVSGFQSLKALSPHECRPFDMERMGMNLGEAAATIILSCDRPDAASPWQICQGAVRNDAFDISAPAKKGEGAVRALEVTLSDTDIDNLALVNAHGTATLFMDQMESVAITRAGLGSIPVNSVKGSYGHTLGAAGVLETVLTMRALDDCRILGTRGFGELGVSGDIKVSADALSTDRQAFVKLISGFGGGNAALLACRGGDGRGVSNPSPSVSAPGLQIRVSVQITPSRVTVNGEQVACQTTGKQLLTELYKRFIGDYPRFYKMDMLSRLGFVASELLLKSEGNNCLSEGDNRAIILFNHSSSLHADRAYLKTISDQENYYPSPSLFVYTLPNIVAGEIAIRNHYHGETSFYILPLRDETVICQVQLAAFLDTSTTSMITGWLDCEDDDHFEADLAIIVKK